MGYMRHEAIVITSWNSEALDAVVAKAVELGLQVLGPSAGVVNAIRSLLICPDGSSEGWTESDEGEQRREALIAYMKTMRHEDGSSPLEWVAIAYGSDDEDAEITDSEWDDELGADEEPG